MHENTQEITDIILKAAKKALKETSGEPEPGMTQPIQWPVECTIGPGLEGGIACETKIGYVNGSKGWLIYRGYNIFDLCAKSSYEEVSYLLLHGSLPTARAFEIFQKKLIDYRYLNKTLRLLMGFPVEDMNTMAALRMGVSMMRQEFTFRDQEEGPDYGEVIGSDEDSIPMELKPWGDKQAIYEFKNSDVPPKSTLDENLEEAFGTEACYHLISGVSTIAAAVTRVRQGRVPIEPDPELSHAGNLLYMMTGERPTAIEERIMDVALVLHADHGMNASTFSAMVVASTQSDIYFSVGSGIAALNGPLHGGANEQVMLMLEEIGSPNNVKKWLEKTLKKKGKVPGFGHRVYRAYDPRARVLGPMAKFLAKKNSKARNIFSIAKELEKQMTERLGSQKKIFPNVDFYSGIVYSCLGIPSDMFTPVFAVSRVAGWTARVHEYLHNNRIFRPRAMYTGEFNKELIPIKKRSKK